MFESIITTTLTPGVFALCLCAALLLGLIISVSYRIRSSSTRSFTVTLATLPAMVAVIIMMVSGNLGAGVAVAGTFSLVRFSSAPGTAREIGAIFLSMAAGLACGMGYLGFAVIFTVVLCGVDLLYNSIGFGEKKGGRAERELRILVPEDLEYYGMFDDLFQKYTTQADLVQVKTTNLGSLNRLSYDVRLKEAGQEKAFIDELRCRNGNLEISLSMKAMNEEAL